MPQFSHLSTGECLSVVGGSMIFIGLILLFRPRYGQCQPTANGCKAISGIAQTIQCRGFSPYSICEFSFALQVFQFYVRHFFAAIVTVYADAFGLQRLRHVFLGSAWFSAKCEIGGPITVHGLLTSSAESSKVDGIRMAIAPFAPVPYPNFFLLPVQGLFQSALLELESQFLQVSTPGVSECFVINNIMPNKAWLRDWRFACSFTFHWLCLSLPAAAHQR